MHEPNTIYIKKKKLLLIFIPILAVIAWGVLNLMAGGLGFSDDSDIQNIPNVPTGNTGGSAGYRPSIPSPGRNTPDITDTREFLKTDYSANIASRDVQRDVDKVENAVKSVDGRIDNINSTEKYGRISFVIPKNNLSEFRDEMEQIAHAKLYTENISSTNLLSQKQAIEERAEYASLSLSELETTFADIEANYLSENGRLQSQLSRIRNDLTDVKNAIAGLGEGETDIFLTGRLSSLESELSSTQRAITNLNSEYISDRNYFNNAIEKAGGEVTAVAAEDTEFMNNIETVAGYVTINWVSVYGYLGYFSPIPMWINTLLLVLVGLWLLRKLGILPRIKLI